MHHGATAASTREPKKNLEAEVLSSPFQPAFFDMLLSTIDIEPAETTPELTTLVIQEDLIIQQCEVDPLS